MLSIRTMARAAGTLQLNAVTIAGPTSQYSGMAQTFTISNYVTGNTYTVTPLSGTVSLSGATITYTAPHPAQANNGFIIVNNGIAKTQTISVTISVIGVAIYYRARAVLRI
jgi:hypothetical protein